MHMSTVDLSELSIADALLVAERDLDRTVSDGLASLDRDEQLLRDLGADAEGLFANLERERAELIAWRDKSLAELYTWLVRDGEMLH
jgi:hypothetical protein